MFRLDADVAAAQGRAAAVLARFERAAAGVLIGTQMVAKGHDFDGVALGVVLDADATLRFPDFRAEERTFALVAQLAGRAGRGGASGRVLVQTLTPRRAQHPLRRRARQRGLPGGRAGATPRAAIPALRRADQDRLLERERRARADRGARAARSPASCLPTPRCSGRRRYFACAGASARSL